MPDQVLKVKKVYCNAYLPTRHSPEAAGLDLYSAFTYVVKKRSKALIDTGLAVEIPVDCYGRIASRSGLAINNSIEVGAGVIDRDYRGIIKVLLFNHSDDDFYISIGERIAQLICEKIVYAHVEEVDSLTDTQRGQKGFGSSS